MKGNLGSTPWLLQSRKRVRRRNGARRRRLTLGSYGGDQLLDALAQATHRHLARQRLVADVLQRVPLVTHAGANLLHQLCRCAQA